MERDFMSLQNFISWYLNDNNQTLKIACFCILALLRIHAKNYITLFFQSLQVINIG